MTDLTLLLNILLFILRSCYFQICWSLRKAVQALNSLYCTRMSYIAPLFLLIILLCEFFYVSIKWLLMVIEYAILWFNTCYNNFSSALFGQMNSICMFLLVFVFGLLIFLLNRQHNQYPLIFLAWSTVFDF